MEGCVSKLEWESNIFTASDKLCVVSHKTPNPLNTKCVCLQHNQLNHCVLGDNSVTHCDTMKGLHILQAGPVQPLAEAGKGSGVSRVVSQLTGSRPALGSSQNVLVPAGYRGTLVWHLFLSGSSMHSCRSHSLSCERTTCSSSWPLLSTAQDPGRAVSTVPWDAEGPAQPGDKAFQGAQ